jgi:hypothetical protein
MNEPLTKDDMALIILAIDAKARGWQECADAARVETVRDDCMKHKNEYGSVRAKIQRMRAES